MVALVVGRDSYDFHYSYDTQVLPHRSEQAAVATRMGRCEVGAERSSAPASRDDGSLYFLKCFCSENSAYCVA